MRKIDFVNGEYYHIYNRGVEKREIFLDDKDYWKFFDGMRDFNNKTFYEERLSAIGISKDRPKELRSFDFKELGSFLKEQEKMVNFVSYNLIPNHFHCVVQQLKGKGIPSVMHKLGTSYTNYFNKKYLKRSGALFQGTYKAIRIDNERYLQWLIGYVNGNIAIHGLGDFENYPWSSYGRIKKELGSRNPKELSSFASNENPLSVLSGLDIIFSQFAGVEQFEEFVKMVIEESKANKEMKKYLLEIF